MKISIKTKFWKREEQEFKDKIDTKLVTTSFLFGLNAIYAFSTRTISPLAYLLITMNLFFALGLILMHRSYIKYSEEVHNERKNINRRGKDKGTKPGIEEDKTSIKEIPNRKEEEIKTNSI